MAHANFFTNTSTTSCAFSLPFCTPTRSTSFFFSPHNKRTSTSMSLVSFRALTEHDKLIILSKSSLIMVSWDTRVSALRAHEPASSSNKWSNYKEEKLLNSEEEEEEEEDEDNNENEATTREEEELAKELEGLEEEEMARGDERRDPSDYDRRAHIFGESSKVFQALKDGGGQQQHESNHD